MKPFFLTLSLLISVFTFAQKQVEIKLNLRDGNTMSGTTTMGDITLKTNYGQLAIPIQNVNSIVVGIGSDKIVKDKAYQYLKVLNSNATDDMKKGAYADLIKLGSKAISAINDFESDPKNNMEVEITGEYTIDNALAEMKNTFHLNFHFIERRFGYVNQNYFFRIKF